MQQNKEVWQSQLIKHLGHWSWVQKLYQYNDTHLVIADRFFIKNLRSARPEPIACKTAFPDTYRAALPGKIKKILVFCQEDELAIIRDIQKRFPDIAVTSGTYGYALVGANRRPTLRNFRRANRAPLARRNQQAPVYLISTSYADAEFISALMVRNGLPAFHEYLARPFATWLQRKKRFQMARFYKAAREDVSKKGEFYCLLQTDVLKSVFANTNFSLTRFIRHLNQTQAKVIMVTRQDKMAQAAIGQILNRSSERSVWTKKPTKRMKLQYGPKDLAGTAKRQLQVVYDEQFLDQIANSGADVFRVCLEEFVADQAVNLDALANFIEVKLPDDVKTLEFDSGYDLAPGLFSAPEDYRRHLADWLGVHSHPLI